MDHLLPTTTTDELRSLDTSTAVLPIGSLEQHGPYLPMTTDTVIACLIGRAIANHYPIQLLSPITISCSHEHSAWPGTVSISATTLYAVISDIRGSLQRSGVTNLVLLNAHGGNYVLRNIVQESTSVSGPSVALFPSTTNWANARLAAGMSTSDHEDMHAGELETSILLGECPDLVRPGYETADHLANERDALLTKGVAHYTQSGVVGRPSMASVAKGKAALLSLVDGFASCLAILNDSPTS